MIRLIKTTLHYHTFKKPFFIAAALLVFLGLKAYSNDMGSLAIEPLSYGIPLVCAVVFLNTHTENQSGAYRNKITAGYTRRQVFFSGIISAAACGAALFLVPAIPIYTSLGTPQTFLTMLMLYVLTAVITACINLNTTSTITTVFTVFLIAAVCFAAAEPVQEELKVEKYDYRFICDESKLQTQGVDGAYTVIEFPNPEYPTGVKRAALKTLAYTNPYSQVLYSELMLSDFYNASNILPKELNHEYLFFPLISAALACAASALSYLAYRQKDLR
ncbi:MAG: hypothetical protein K6F27_03800 [Ruminococcus sp.]|nr:hypothetical protein [Ruminococcus sp.]